MRTFGIWFSFPTNSTCTTLSIDCLGIVVVAESFSSLFAFLLANSNSSAVTIDNDDNDNDYDYDNSGDDDDAIMMNLQLKIDTKILYEEWNE